MKGSASGKQYGSLDAKRPSRSASPTKRNESESGSGSGSKLRRHASAPQLERKDSDASKSGTSRRGRDDSSDSKASSKASQGSVSSRATSGTGGPTSRKDASPGPKGRPDKKQQKKFGAETPLASTGPRLADALPAEREGLILSKLQTCSVVYDFHADTMLREKEEKRQILLELIDYANTAQDKPSEAFMQASVDMASANVFRTLELRERLPVDMLDMDDEEPFMDPAWPHLQLVYEFLLRFVLCKVVEPKVVAKFLNPLFLARFLELFDSDDCRERDAIKVIMLKLYSRCTNMRTNIRRALQDACSRALYEDDTPNGVAELLELLLKIINSFSSPLKDEQKGLFHKVIIPLHKVAVFSLFQRPLVQCVFSFIDKDKELCYEVVMALLNFWPFTSGSKQVLFLEELEQLLPLLPSSDFLRLRDLLTQRLVVSITCIHASVAERALQLWNTQSFVRLVNQHRVAMFPPIISALYRNCTQHWYGSVHGRTLDVLKIVMEADQALFADASARHRRMQEETYTIEENRARKWGVLRQAFEKKERQTALAKPKAKRVSVKAKSKSGQSTQKFTTPQYRHDIISLVQDNYGFIVSLDSSQTLTSLDLQALIVDRQGDVVSIVSADNATERNAALVHASYDELRKEDSDSHRHGVAIWVTLPRVPAHVKQLFFVVCSTDGPALRRELLKGCSARVVDAQDSATLANFAIDVEPTGVGVLAVMERPSSDGGWRFARTVLGRSGDVSPTARSAKHFVDALEPTLGSLVREVIPTAMKPQRVSLILEKGAVTDIIQSLAPKGFFAGIGWDFSNRGYSDERLAVEVAAVFFSATGKELGAATAEKPTEFGVRHSGSGMLSSGVAFTFDGLSKDVAQMLLVVHVSTPHMTFDMLQNPSCRIIDQTGVTILSFTLPECTRKSGLILGRLALEPAVRKRWCFQAIGRFCGGHSWKDEETTREMRSIAQLSLREFQFQLEGFKPVAPTSSGRLLASI